MNCIDIGSEITFSEYSAQDHDGVVDCINSFYMGGYPYPDYLDANNLQKLVSGGDMIMTVAKNRAGRVVGTSAAHRLSGVFSGSVLLLLRCVADDYRGKGIGTAEEKFLFDLIYGRFGNSDSLYADVMTHDAISQTTLSKSGFAFCGFRMSLYKNEIICPKIKFAEGTKMTQAIYCKALAEKKVRIFAPENETDYIKKIYENLKIPCEFMKEPGEPENPQTVYLTERNELHGSREIYVTNSGTAGHEGLTAEARQALDCGDTCVIYINMNQSTCPEIYSKLKKNGFVFSGIKPLSGNGEYLVMSGIQNCVKNISDIKYPGEKEDLVKYIFGGFHNEP